MTIKENLEQLLHMMRDEQLALDGRLTEAEREEVGTADRWSARDMLAHNMAWAGRTLDDLQLVAVGEAPVEFGEDDDENAAIFAAHQGASWEAVRELIASAYAGIDAYLAGRDDQALTAVPEGLSRPVWREISGHYITHPMVHLWDYLHKHGHDDALEALFGEPFFARLLALAEDDEWRGVVVYDRACMYAVSGRRDHAVAELGEALRLHPGLREWSMQDSDLDSLRELPGYRALYPAD